MKSSGLNVLSYESKNPDGKPAILLHGLGSSGEDWFLQVPVLRKHHDVYAVDLPGHGGSPPFDFWPLMEDYAQSLASWMKEHDLERAHVVGLSLGGLVGLQLALDRPQFVVSLTIVNAFSRMRTSFRGGLHSVGRLLLLVFGRMDWLGTWVASALFPEGGQESLRELAAARIAATPRKSYLQAVRAIARFSVDDRLKELNVPVLVVAGGRDRIVPLTIKRVLADQIRSAQFELIPESGHVTPIDANDRFNQLLVDFLAG
jgi:3-oxoadipate enol-lactonase